MAEMRELARLVVIFKRLLPTAQEAEEMFCRDNLATLREAIGELATAQDGSEKHGTKLFIDSVIKKSIKALMGYYTENKLDNKHKELKKFLAAYGSSSL